MIEYICMLCDSTECTCEKAISGAYAPTVVLGEGRPILNFGLEILIAKRRSKFTLIKGDKE